MAIVHTNSTVGTTPTLICRLPKGIPYTAVSIYNNDNNPIFLGDSTITTSTGSQITSKALPVQLWLHAGDELYAVSAAGTIANGVSVIYSGI